jgi:S-(hydroxymethyl)glutathione dehydrogenase / alcohol dehydrogenase
VKVAAIVLDQVRQPLVVEELELDDPKQGELQVKMTASGVCHSCLHAADGSWGDMQVPMVLGDEGAGVVTRVGPGVADLAPGDHVIISWAPACGRCHYCASGRPVLCESNQLPFPYASDGTVRMHRANGQDVYHYGPATYASELIVPQSCAVKVRDDMPLDKAALIGCSVMTGVGSVINTARVPAGASLAVFGCGGVGLNAVQGGRLAAASPLIAVDVADNKLEFARGLGASHTVNAAREDVPEAIRRITGRGAEYAVVAVGDVRAVHQAWESLSPGGTCVLIGLPPVGQKLELDPFSFVAFGHERRLIASRYGSARIFEDFPRLVELYLAGILRIDELITRRYTPDEANEGFRALAAGENARALIVF